MEREEWLWKSGVACEYLMGIEEVRRATRIHCYVSMERERELATSGILAWLCSERKAVFMPYIDQGRMMVARYLAGHRFRSRESGPPAPEPLIIDDEKRFDAVIVPVVGADLNGGRLGYGKGWYDRFFESLAAVGQRPLRIGLCFGFQIVTEVPLDPWDQSLDVVVTENGIFNCVSGRI